MSGLPSHCGVELAMPIALSSESSVPPGRKKYRKTKRDRDAVDQVGEEEDPLEQVPEPRWKRQDRGEVQRQRDLHDRRDDVVQADEEDVEQLGPREELDVVVEADEVLRLAQAVPVGERVPEHVHDGDVREHDQERHRHDQEQPRRGPASRGTTAGGASPAQPCGPGALAARWCVGHRARCSVMGLLGCGGRTVTESRAPRQATRRQAAISLARRPTSSSAPRRSAPWSRPRRRGRRRSASGGSVGLQVDLRPRCRSLLRSLPASGDGVDLDVLHAGGLEVARGGRAAGPSTAARAALVDRRSRTRRRTSRSRPGRPPCARS